MKSAKKKYTLLVIVEPTGTPHAYTLSWTRKQAIEVFCKNLWGAQWDTYKEKGYRAMKASLEYVLDGR